MPQVKICKIRRTEKSDVKEVYSTKQTQSQAGPRDTTPMSEEWMGECK